MTMLHHDTDKHVTPGPWVVHNRGIGFEIAAEQGRTVNDGFRETFSKSDAEFIVAARNFRHAIETGQRPHLSDTRALFPWMNDHSDATLSLWIESTTVWPGAFRRLDAEAVNEKRNP